jgi:predicted XRE-type DNA-binding protein
MKELRLVDTSLDDLAQFPPDAKRAAGFELWQVQNGLDPSDWKPMNNVGIGARDPGSCRRPVEGDVRREVRRNGFRAARFRQEDAAHAASRYRPGGRPLQRDCEAMKRKITKSSGNVFTDLGFAPDEVAVLTLRAELMVALRKLIAAKGWTQAQAAEELGVTQSRVSDLVRGKHEKFSLDVLVTLAARAGRTVKLRLAA